MDIGYPASRLPMSRLGPRGRSPHTVCCNVSHQQRSAIARLDQAAAAPKPSTAVARTRARTIDLAAPPQSAPPRDMAGMARANGLPTAVCGSYTRSTEFDQGLHPVRTKAPQSDTNQHASSGWGKAPLGSQTSLRTGDASTCRRLFHGSNPSYHRYFGTSWPAESSAVFDCCLDPRERRLHPVGHLVVEAVFAPEHVLDDGLRHPRRAVGGD